MMCAGVHSRGTLLTAGTTLEGEVPLTSAMPYFVELQNSVNVTGQLGAGAELHCKVNQPSKETAVRTSKICCFTFCVVITSKLICSIEHLPLAVKILCICK